MSSDITSLYIVDNLLAARALARARKDYAEADSYREELKKMGVTAIDTAEGQKANGGTEYTIGFYRDKVKALESYVEGIKRTALDREIVSSRREKCLLYLLHKATMTEEGMVAWYGKDSENYLQNIKG